MKYTVAKSSLHQGNFLYISIPFCSCKLCLRPPDSHITLHTGFYSLSLLLTLPFWGSHQFHPTLIFLVSTFLLIHSLVLHISAFQFQAPSINFSPAGYSSIQSTFFKHPFITDFITSCLHITNWAEAYPNLIALFKNIHSFLPINFVPTFAHHKICLSSFLSLANILWTYTNSSTR